MGAGGQEIGNHLSSAMRLAAHVVRQEFPMPEPKSGWQILTLDVGRPDGHRGNVGKP
jgi:hypothetical protein